MHTIKTICVYCGSSLGEEPIFQDAAKALGKALAEKNINLVYGGGSQGLMGTVAKAVQENKGYVTGIIPEFLINKETNDQHLKQLDQFLITKTMHERKYEMFKRADAFIALPGGIGTLEELIEMLTWAQLKQHEKPIVIANINNFWNPLFQVFEHMQKAGFLKDLNKAKPLIANNIADIFSVLKL